MAGAKLQTLNCVSNPRTHLGRADDRFSRPGDVGRPAAILQHTSHGRFNDYKLLYPRPHLDDVAAAAKLTDVDADLLYGVLRQESLFRSDAASSAGALGLAQLSPATARETARRWSLPAPNRADLFDPKISITLGAARLRELEQRFGS